jgi:hypothetical protein
LRFGILNSRIYEGSTSSTKIKEQIITRPKLLKKITGAQKGFTDALVDKSSTDRRHQNMRNNRSRYL